MLTNAEIKELYRLRWVQRYYLDAWMANMQFLDALRPAIVQLHDRETEIIDLLERHKIGMDEAEQMHLAEMRRWWEEYQHTVARANIEAPN